MKDDITRLLGSLGLAARARKLTYGTELTVEAAERNLLSLVILSNEASQNTLKKVKRSCEENGIPLYTVDIESEKLTLATGKKRPIMTIGVMDKNFTDLIRKNLTDSAVTTAFTQTYSESEV